MPIDFKKRVPTTLEEAVDIVIDGMTDPEKSYMLTEGISGLHHGVGTSIRNRWGLWTGSQLKGHLMTRFGLGHADDLSSLIVHAAIHKIRGDTQPIETLLSAVVERFRAHWERMGLHPLTLEKAIPDDHRIESPS